MSPAIGEVPSFVGGVEGVYVRGARHPHGPVHARGPFETANAGAKTAESALLICPIYRA